MKIIKDDKYYLEKMLLYIDYILKYAENIKKHNSVIKPNDQLSDGIAYKVIQLKEESKNLSIEFLQEHKNLCRHISLLNGFRNRITHDYDNVQYSFFNEMVEIDLPELKKIIENIFIEK